MKKISALIIIGLLCLSMFATLLPKAKAVIGDEATIFFDNFEGYDVGTFPSAGGWNLVYDGMGTEYQKIVDDVRYSGSKSFQLWGVSGWSACADKAFTPAQRYVGYEAYVMTTGYGPENIAIHFMEYNTPALIASVNFGADSKIYSRSYAPEWYTGIPPGPAYDLNTTYTANRWYKVKVVVDRNTNTYDVWIDDILRGSALSTQNSANIGGLRLGSGHSGVKVYYDDVKVFETNIAKALVGYWKFDEGSGSVAYDSSGNENTGTVYGAQWVEGVKGGALRFDGIDDHVYIPSSPSLTVTGSQITVEIWLRPSITLDATSPFINFIDKGNEYGFQISQDGYNPTPDGKIWFYVGLELSGWHWEGIQTTTNRWIADTWYHLAGVYDGNSIKIYVNGVLENSRPLSGNLCAQGAYPLSIGSYTLGNQYFFNGVIDEAKIYNYARTTEEIWNDYVNVQQPDFTISVSPESQIAQPDSSLYYQISVASKGGFSSSVTLSASFSPYPVHIGWDLIPSVVIPPPNGQVVAKLKVNIYDDTPLKTFTIRVIAQSGSIEKSYNVKLNVERSLEVPYQHQDSTDWCGPTSLAMVLHYYGINFHSWDYARIKHLPVDLGTYLSDLEKFINENYYPQVFACPRELYDIGKVKSSISNGYPVILGLHNPSSQKERHSVVVIGYNETGMFINDPSGALFTDPLFLGGGYGYPESFNHAYVDWTIIKSFADQMVSVQGYASLIPSGTVWIEDKNGISFGKQDHAHLLYMSRGLQWLSTDSKDDGYIMHSDSDLTIKVYVSNSKQTSRAFTCNVYIHKEGDFFKLRSESVTRLAFRYNEMPVATPMDSITFYVSHDELNSRLAIGEKYWLEIELEDDTAGIVVDNFYTPPFYWVIGQTHKLKEKSQHLYLHIYDEQGNHVGLNYVSGQVEVDILNSYYFDDGNGSITIVLPRLMNVSIVVDARYAEELIESYDITVTFSSGIETYSKTYSDVIYQMETKHYSTIVSMNGSANIIDWEHVFEDPKRGTILKVSTDDKFFQFVAPDKDFGIKCDADMKVLNHVIIICYEDSEMRLVATAVNDKIDFCSAIAWDKQTRKCYLLIDKPNLPRYIRCHFFI